MQPTKDTVKDGNAVEAGNALATVEPTSITSNNENRPNHTPGGRFAIGNKAGKGNQALRRQHALRATLIRHYSGAQVTRAFDKAFAMFEAGDMIAGKLWAEYVLGKPRFIDENQAIAAGGNVFQFSFSGDSGQMPASIQIMHQQR